MIESLMTAIGIVVPAIAVTLLVRRWLGTHPWRVAAGFLVLTLVVLARPIFTPGMPVALDAVVSGYPYRGIFGEVKSINPDTNDTVRQFLPWMQVAREEILAGRAPLWNRYSWSGYPLLGNAQSAPYSPFFLLTLFVPLPKQIVAIAGLKLFVGLLFGWLFLKNQGLSHWPAAFGSVTFALSVFHNIFLYYPLSSVTLLFPALAFGVVECLRRPQLRSIVLLAVVSACVLAAGHPGMVILSMIGVAILVLLEIIDDLPPLRGIAALAAAAGLGAAISAPAWLPLFQQALISERMMAVETGAFSAAIYPIGALWALVNPEAYGNPARGNWSWIFHYIMIATVYVGLLPLALLPAGLLSPKATRRDGVTVAVLLVLLLVVLGWTPLGRWIGSALVWAGKDRLRFLIVFLVACLAARTVERMREGSVWPELGGSAIAFALGLYVFVKKLGITLSWIHAVGLVALLAFWLVFFVKRRNLQAPVACIGVALELIVFNWAFNAITDRRYFRPHLPILDRIHADAPGEPFRIVGYDWVFLPNGSAQYGLEDVRGSDPMAWRDYIEFFRLIQVSDQAPDVGRVQDIAHPAIGFLNVRYLIAEPDSRFGGPWRLIYRGRDGTLYRHEHPLPRFYTPANVVRRDASPLGEQLGRIGDFRETVVVEGTGGANTVLPGMWIRQMSPRRFRLTLDPPRRLFVASSQPAMPGWQVRINGEPTRIYRVNGAFIGFFVPAGHTRVVVEHKPLIFFVSILMSLTGLLALILIAWVRHRSGMTGQAGMSTLTIGS